MKKKQNYFKIRQGEKIGKLMKKIMIKLNVIQEEKLKVKLGYPSLVIRPISFSKYVALPSTVHHVDALLSLTDTVPRIFTALDKTRNTLRVRV